MSWNHYDVDNNLVYFSDYNIVVKTVRKSDVYNISIYSTIAKDSMWVLGFHPGKSCRNDFINMFKRVLSNTACDTRKEYLKLKDSLEMGGYVITDMKIYGCLDVINDGEVL